MSGGQAILGRAIDLEFALVELEEALRQVQARIGEPDYADAVVSTVGEIGNAIGEMRAGAVDLRKRLTTLVTALTGDAPGEVDGLRKVAKLCRDLQANDWHCSDTERELDQALETIEAPARFDDED